MFNLIVRGPWVVGRGSFLLGRVFEYTEDDIQLRFSDNDLPSLDRLAELPCIFMQEGIENEVARVGYFSRPRLAAGEITFEVAFDLDIPQMTNRFVFQHRAEFGIPNAGEFSRNHWAIKDVDLFRTLYRLLRPQRQRPTIFRITENEQIERDLLSVMMPFDARFDSVLQSIQAAARNAELRCLRADDIWEHDAIIQDVVSLIDRSRIVVCDCSGRNPNVFYEAGIAHTLGREVILITQSEADIPFDLRHLRHIQYLDNDQGRNELANELTQRIRFLMGR